jgi:hypothetical protein
MATVGAGGAAGIGGKAGSAGAAAGGVAGTAGAGGMIAMAGASGSGGIVGMAGASGATGTPASCAGPVRVFPCAEGFGIDSIAGRKGKILRVTNLDDSGPGSLRAAVEDSQPRVVVFELSGNIVLTKTMKITNPFITIAGQTAPSPGITVRNSTLGIRSHDILIQHIRFRLGDEQTAAPDSADAVQLLGTGLGTPVYNVVLDHCSFAWGIDETLSLNYEPHDVTISNVIVSESLSHAGHPEVEHSKGLLFGNNTKNVIVMRSLLAHNVDRNPFIKGGAEAAVVNNVFYNWGKPFGARLGSSDSASWPIKASIVGNTYIKGVNSPANSYAVAVHQAVKVGTQLFNSKNIAIGVPPYLNEAPFDPLVNVAPIWPKILTELPNNTVEDAVYSHAGARPNDRDAVDTRIVLETRTRSGKVIDSQKQVGGYPTLSVNKRAFVEPANPNGDADGDGYTDLEELLFSLAKDLE